MTATLQHTASQADDLQQGYKRTEVGVIPVEWEVNFIEDLLKISTGARNTQDRVDDGAYPFFVRSQNVESINTYSYNEEAVLTAGDGVGTGKVFHYINGKYDAHQRVYRIFGFSEAINGKYFFKIFSNNFYDRIMQMTAKSSVDSVRRDMIARMLIPVPKIKEQELIVAVLSDVDGLIASLTALIAKKRAVKHATMQQLLTGKTRLAGFSGEWEVKRLESLGIFSKGQGIRKDEAKNGSIPCIRYGEIYTIYNTIIQSYHSFISSEVAKTSVKLRCGDILFAGSGETKEEIGKCVAFIDEIEVYAGGDIVIFTPFNANSYFLGYALNDTNTAKQKASMGQGDAVVHISARSLATVKIPLPPLPEQTAIAAILTDMDTDITTLETRLAKTKALKTGMCQDLLTGKIRLL